MSAPIQVFCPSDSCVIRFEFKDAVKDDYKLIDLSIVESEALIEQLQSRIKAAKYNNIHKLQKDIISLRGEITVKRAEIASKTAQLSKLEEEHTKLVADSGAIKPCDNTHVSYRQIPPSDQVRIERD